VASPPPAVTADWLYYDFDGPPTRLQNAARPTTYYEGGTAPGDSGGPLYMFENGRWYVIGNADTTAYAPGASIADGQWHVVVATWDGSEVTGDAVGNDRNLSVYLDGSTNVTRVQAAEFFNVARNGVSLTLGGSRTAARYLDGRIAEVRLYRGALDEAGVADLVRELKDEHVAPQFDFALTSR
jgi:hypothetical protein